MRAHTSAFLSIRRPALAASFIVVAVSISGCADTLYYGERSSFKLGIHVNDNPVTPLQVNMGVKRTVVAISPPRGTRSSSGRQLPDGEAVNLFSGFDLQYDRPESWANPFAGTVTIKAQFASGAAAQRIAGNTEVVEAIVDVAAVSKQAQEILDRESAAAKVVAGCVATAQGSVDGQKLAAIVAGVFRPADAARYVARFGGKPIEALKKELESGTSRTAAPKMAARLDTDCRIAGG